MKANATSSAADILRQAMAGDWKNQTEAYLAWTALVKTDGPWDFKVELNRAQQPGVVLGGQALNFDVVANFHYGYVGIASGFSPEALLKGAGLAQIKAGTSQWSYWNSNFDDPYDQFAAWLGMWLYQQYGDKLTKEQFNAAINKHGSCLSGGGGAPCSIPSNP